MHHANGVVWEAVSPCFVRTSRRRKSDCSARRRRDAATSKLSPPPGVCTRSISHRSMRIREARASHSTFADARSNACAGARVTPHKNDRVVSAEGRRGGVERRHLLKSKGVGVGR